MYTPEQIQKAKTKIVKGLANGKSLSAIIRKGRKPNAKTIIPGRTTIYTWLNPNHDDFDANFLNNYTQAREDSADVDADKLEQIAKDVQDGKLEPAQARAAADIIKWLAGRKKPKKYGDKLDVTTAGKELAQQVTIFKLPSNGRDEDGAED